MQLINNRIKPYKIVFTYQTVQLKKGKKILNEMNFKEFNDKYHTAPVEKQIKSSLFVFLDFLTNININESLKIQECFLSEEAKKFYLEAAAIYEKTFLKEVKA